MKTFPMNTFEVYACGSAHAISDGVIFTGPLYGRDNLEAYTDVAVYVLPSRYDAFPMSVLEALACGTPIVLTENCGIAEYFRDKVGLVIKPDPNYLSKALLDILSNECKRYLFMNNCREIIEDFKISKTTSKLEEVYESIGDIRDH